MTRRPNLFIVGAPKSGTTSLYDYLEGHPDVFMSPVKEPGYFAPDIKSRFASRLSHGEDEARYLALFAGARDEAYLGEASTRYLVSRQAAQLVREFNPEARIVAAVRNPVDMIYSFHNERVSQGSETVADFAAALALDDDRRRGVNLPPGSNALAAVYRDTALFGEQLARWIDAFGRQRVHVIVFDDFARDTPTEFRRVLEFLGIDAAYRPPAFEVANRSHRSRGGIVRMLLGNRVAKALRHRVMPGVLGEDRAARWARRIRQSRINRRPNPRPPLAPELRLELERFYTPDVARLSELLGRDLVAEWFGSTSAERTEAAA